MVASAFLAEIVIVLRLSRPKMRFCDVVIGTTTMSSRLKKPAMFPFGSSTPTTFRRRVTAPPSCTYLTVNERSTAAFVPNSAFAVSPPRTATGAAAVMSPLVRNLPYSTPQSRTAL